MYLMHPAQMGENKKAWIIFHHLKFVTAIILFTPVNTLLPLSKNMRIDIQFYWIMTSLILAPMARYYREYSTLAEVKSGMMFIFNHEWHRYHVIARNMHINA
jgi:hypothetical protein